VSLEPRPAQTGFSCSTGPPRLGRGARLPHERLHAHGAQSPLAGPSTWAATSYSHVQAAQPLGPGMRPPRQHGCRPGPQSSVAAACARIAQRGTPTIRATSTRCSRCSTQSHFFLHADARRALAADTRWTDFYSTPSAASAVIMRRRFATLMRAGRHPCPRGYGLSGRHLQPLWPITGFLRQKRRARLGRGVDRGGAAGCASIPRPPSRRKRVEPRA